MTGTPTPGVSVSPSHLPFMKDPDNTLPLLLVGLALLFAVLAATGALKRKR